MLTSTIPSLPTPSVVVKDARSVSGKSAVTAKTEDTNYNSDFDESDKEDVEDESSLTSNEEIKPCGSNDDLESPSPSPKPIRGMQRLDSMVFNKANVAHSDISPQHHQQQQRRHVLSDRENQAIFNSNKGKMVVFYKKHNKGKLRSIEDTLHKYAGKEEDLYALILAKYGKKKTAKFALQTSYPPGVDADADADEESDSEDDIEGGGMSAQMQARMMAMKNKTGMRACDSMKLIPTTKTGHDSDDSEDNEDDDIDGGGMTPQMAARMLAQQQTAMKNKTGMRAMDSMKLIPTFKDADDGDEDDDWSLEDETQLLTSTLAQNNTLRTPIPITGRTISFGVLPDVFSTTSLKACTKGFSEPPPHPLPLVRNLSYSEEVRINHVKSFKHELTTKEIEEVWYQDWEMVMMKFDCGLYGKEAENRQKQNQEKVNAARAKKKNTSSTKKVKDTKTKKKTTSAASAGDDKKKKKKGLFGFGKKK